MKKKIKTIKSRDLQSREDIRHLPSNEWVKVEGGFEVEHIFSREISAKEKPRVKAGQRS